ncbi:hypothetical protein A4H97_29690 [Niastella yeongjuensis]|uniref:Uncharacterized protein n=1 Tax=Niastella yeongjuensis TaxID=354355 RepID=A0A1V9EPC1_9BACT|nr:hypothetical protein [Niastella yeongjuensis]OQP48013.1 hypothetical protein A4H97_29690 [Niastella yeongjuensis]SEO23498.1 hypothetical protein SAMN05660816_02337 [Niastella yeongjuensis]
MKELLIVLFGTFFSIQSYCQQKYKGLVELAMAPGKIVFRNPLKTLYLFKDDMWSYSSNIQELKEIVDTGVILEIIANSAHMDTSDWSEAEIENVILIEKENDKISKRTVKNVLKKVPPSRTPNLKHFNSLPFEKRNIVAYSRPVFDKSGNYAVIAYRSRGQWGAMIFHFVNNQWHELGVLVRWVV